MKVLIEGKSRKAIVTIAIGDEFLRNFLEGEAIKSWKFYCQKHGFWLIIFENDLIEPTHPKWKKATWQKTLIGKQIKNKKLPIDDVCYMDTDFIISPIAKNIFNYYDSNKIGLVSLRNNLPYNYSNINRLISWYRHHYYDSKYPLDSAIHISLRDLYEQQNLTPVEDEACMGLILFNITNHSKTLENIFLKYDKNVYSLTGGGDQGHYNYEFQSLGIVQWLNYEWQAIWVNEMAFKYNFLYFKEDRDLIRLCINSSLKHVNFLHFAGSWHESRMIDDFCWNQQGVEFDLKYLNYREDKSITGLPKGVIKP